MNMLNPFHRQQILYEKKSMLLSTVRDLTGGKRKYVTMKELQTKMNVNDDEMNSIMDSAFKSNRHTNTYTFTTIDGEPAIGIAKAKRKSSEPQMEEREEELPDHPLNKGKSKEVWKPMEKNTAYESRETELYRWQKAHGYKGLMRAAGSAFPEDYKGMNERQVIEYILAEEFAPEEEKPSKSKKKEEKIESELQESYSGAILPGRNYFAERLMK